MINRLTLTPNTKYDSLTESERAFMADSHEKAAMITGSARSLCPADDIEGVDLDPAPGRIHIQGAKDTTVLDQQMILKDPAQKTFDIKNVESFDMKVVDRSNGQFAHMSIESDVQFDADGDGSNEKGMLCTMEDGMVNLSAGKMEVNSSFKVFVNEGGQAVTILEETPSRIWTPDSMI
ncbi:MAG: hypothetical protein AB9903_05465 [Vulcanimicrobiota bacterium]